LRLQMARYLERVEKEVEVQALLKEVK
jgi:hypothetical protein